MYNYGWFLWLCGRNQQNTVKIKKQTKKLKWKYLLSKSDKDLKIFLRLSLRTFGPLLLFSRSVMSDSANPWTAAHQASLSFAISRSLLKLMSIELVMPSNHLILCCHLLLLPSVLPNVRVFPNESALQITWPKYWSFSFSLSPSNEYSGLISFGID